jgi:uncharacterized membrane protein YhiD involved in acid resistance
VTIGEPIGWLQLSELGLVLVLSALIGFERETREKSADLWTYTLVGLASALILLVGMAGGAGLPILAIAATTSYYIVVVILPAVERHLPKSRWAPASIQVACCGGRDVLTQILTACSQHDFAVTRLLVKGADDESPGFQDDSVADAPLRAGIAVKLRIEVHGTKSIPRLAARIADIPGVASVQAGDAASG